MAQFIIFPSFYLHVGRAVMNLDADTLKVALTNSAPSSGNSLLSDITQIATGAGYASGGFSLSGVDYSLDGSIGELTATDLVITASGGTMATWRYPVIYDDTPSNPLKPLIGYLDVGTGISLADGQSRTLDFSSVNGILRLGAGTLS